MLNRTALDAWTPVPVVRRPPGGPFTRWPGIADTVLAVVVFLMVLVQPGPGDDIAWREVGDVPIADLAVFAIAAGALRWRRSWPLTVFGVTLGATFLSIALDNMELVGFAMMIALYSVGRHVPDNRWSWSALAGALVLVMTSSLVVPAPLVETGFGLFLMFFVWFGGRQLRLRGEYAAQLEQRHAAEARRTVAEERTRIARELHDVVAHRVSLMTVQAGAAKTVAAVDPERAAQAMQAVETAGRQALDELRHLLGVLRPEAEGDALGPQPGLGDVGVLVDQFRAAGLDVSLTMDRPPTDLPVPVDLSAFRIVQEALTNALKHAGPDARTDVRVDADDRGVSIEVLDDGRGVTVLTGSGHGIVGMRERALLLGGRLDAGPREGRGFRVIAHLPVGQAPA